MADGTGGAVLSVLDTSEEEDSEEEFIDMMLTITYPRQPKRYHQRQDYFVTLRDDEFLNRFRLSKEVVVFLVHRIRPCIESPTTMNHAVSAEHKVLITLRYFATGSFLRVCGDFTGVHISTASRIIAAVSRCIAGLRPEFIKMPLQAEEMKRVSQEFYSIAKFPRCIGAIDCTHIKIKSPGGDDAEIYRNRKGWFSLNVQTVSDAKCQIQNIVARWPGSAHDCHILRNSAVRAQFEQGKFGEYVLVGDSGYGVSDYLLTPLSEPSNPAEDLYNEAQIYTRNPVERSYGIWKRRFPVLSIGMNVRMITAMAIIVATAVLHNIACHFGNIVPPNSPEVEKLVQVSIFPSDSLPRSTLSTAVRRVKQSERKRNRYVRYFASLLQ